MSAEFEALKYVMGQLKANPTLISKIGAQPDGTPSIHNECHADLTDPIYPVITVELLGNPDDRMVQEPEIEINIWCKAAGVLKWELHDLVLSALLIKAGSTPGAWVIGVQKTSVIGNLNEPKLKLYRVLSRYVVTTVQK